MESLEIILENYDGEYTQEEKQTFAEEKNSSYQQLLRSMTPADLSISVKGTLEELRRMGIKLAIGSSSKNAGIILERIGLDDFFDAVSDGNNISRSKPDGEVFEKAAQYIQLPSERCLVVEDAQAGLLAAANAGMDSAGIGDAARSDLAVYHLDNFTELVEIVKDRQHTV